METTGTERGAKKAGAIHQIGATTAACAVSRFNTASSTALLARRAGVVLSKEFGRTFSAVR